MKGIILAGGKGTRLQPCTLITSKQLLPVFNKPLIYYSLNTLLKAGIKDILIILAPEYAGHYLKLLGSGKKYGANFTYEIQEEPKGLADAFIIGEDFIDKGQVAMILGDNIFEDSITQAVDSFQSGGRVFAKEVPDPERFGVVEFDDHGHALTIEEKPKQPKSNYCVTGMYIYDNRVVDMAKNLKPSERGEIEITDINNEYLKLGELDVQKVEGEWFDTGTFESLLMASNWVSQNQDLFQEFPD